MAHPFLPTTVLPALADLHACSAICVGEALRVLRDVYFPHAPSSTAMGAVPVLKQSLSKAVPVPRPKRIARLIHYDGVPDSGYASAEEDEQSEQDDGTHKTGDAETTGEEMEEEDEALDMDILRSNELERGYAINWITGLRELANLEEASRLLARFAGDDIPEEALTRTFVFPFRMPSCHRCRRWDVSPITVELNDAPVDGTDHTAVGLQSWGSAIVFAERMCLDPERYLGSLHPCTSIPTATCLGAGTGLLSITAAQILSRMPVRAKIKATDYHPSVLENLDQNVRHNHSSVDVSVEKLDWCVVSRTEGGGGVYDVVLAADVVYLPEHACWIRGCVGQTLKMDGVFWLIVPVRTTGRHEGLGETVEEAFPVVGRVSGGERSGVCLGIVGRERVERVDGVGRADEGGYTLFEIRWG
ncbi:hypothetical protein HD554DRAFT_2250050 [Boletus coccyginus]|nr:hypothetical protein HD554DRAFT_2250050 [Boletus coccyginus]